MNTWQTFRTQAAADGTPITTASEQEGLTKSTRESSPQYRTMGTTHKLPKTNCLIC